MSGTTLACPQCGGANALPSGERLLLCAFCEATLFVDRSGLVSHYRLPRLVDRATAAEALRRWMAGNDTVKDLDQKATISSVAAITFPMWLFRRSAGGGSEETRVEPAAAIPIPQVADLALPAGRLEPCLEAEDGAERLAATVPLETARSWLGTSGGALSETALVEVPFWRCRYAYAEREYTALVEGSTGAVVASIYPEKAESPFYLTAALGAVAFLVAGFLTANPFFKLGLYALIAVPLLGLAWLVSRKV
ncbi:MAG TPA: hypothetical protein VF017_05460 [Thermoanaerobaculia bacterium]|nr:hypothetical protein [Thermoanaerobaculia bacterium]